MIISENQSVFEGEVRSVTPAGDGFGSEISFAVSKNISPDPAFDFIRAKTGDVLVLFSAKPAIFERSKNVVVTTHLNAGPGKSRIVVNSLENAD